jgi:hypothetical protein
VLLKELQSLCLNVEVLSSDGVALEMRETDDEVFRARRNWVSTCPGARTRASAASKRSDGWRASPLS